MTQSKKHSLQTGNKSNSQEQFETAKSCLVGGVNSPVRAFKSVDSSPVFMAHAEGAYLVSEDDRRYLDYVLAFGPHLLGHAHPTITKAIQQAAEKGTAFGAPTTAETTLAKLIQSFYPHLEKIRLVNSGTEATMSALRLARGATGRTKILKFDGCYHGHEDALLVKTGSGGLTLGQPDSAGVPDSVAENTLSIPYNDPAALQTAFATHGSDIAAIIVEPVCGNMGVILPKDNFLHTLQSTCKEHGSLLIFDEVMIGFRAGKGGIQSQTGITPDITCLGKVIGGGLPCGAYGASAKLMAQISPEGPVYQAGTLSGNPLVTAAGIAMLYVLSQEKTQNALTDNMTQLTIAIQSTIDRYAIPVRLQHFGTLFTLFFTDKPVETLENAQNCDTDRFKRFHRHMLQYGIYLAPSPFEAAFISTEHTAETIEKFTHALDQFLQKESL